MRIAQDLRFALRTIGKTPGFAVSAVLALGLGIGANSAMFSVIDQVLLRPVPYPDSGRLVNVWETNLKRNFPRFPVAPANYYDWRKQNRVFSALAGYQQNVFTLASKDNEPERFTGAICDSDLFRVLQVQPLVGRVFSAEEDQPGRDQVVVMGYGLWRSRFAGDPKIVGQTIMLDNKPRTIVGIMPEGFDFPSKATLWAPLGFDDPTRARRDFHRLFVAARLGEGVSLEQARAAFQTVSSRLEAQYPVFNKDEGIAVNPMLDDLVGPIRPALLVLLGAVGFVLLIACANVANLLLAKAAGRQREIAIRASLGASRLHIARQMLTESLLLAAGGGAFGLAIAWGAFAALLRMAPGNIPRLHQAHLDWRAVLFTAAVSLVTGVLFGFAPAWTATREDFNPVLKEGSRGTTSRGRLRNALVSAQVAAALILLAGAGLLIRSFEELARVDAGFVPEHLITMRVAPAPARYRDKAEMQIQFAKAVARNAAALPGVRSVALATDIPLLGNPIYIIRFEGRPPVDPSQAPIANYFGVTPGFFDAMGMRVVRGRPIGEQDTATSPPVVVVNQTLADRYFPGQDPLKQRLEIGFSTPPNWRQIVGVVADVRTAGLDRDSPVQVYAAYLQQPVFLPGFVAPLTVVARTTGEPATLAAPIKQAILNVDRGQPVFAVQPMTEVVSQSIAQRRLSLVLLTFFALSALFLAALGIFGVMSYSVTQRIGEIGIRLALGARESQVLFHVQAQGIKLVAMGVVAGVAGALALTRLMRTLLFRVHSTDPLTYISVAALLVLVAVVASYLPARRAARVDPLVALRYE